ncbi:hypothetical protein NQZ68_022969 [Dissostichus eleginoides]|nr:hypothetical protein NQZ68_022969 [Dissostichus eleginoides]
MLNILVVTNTLLHISSFIAFLDSQAPTKLCLSAPSHQPCVHKTTFSPEHGKLPSILPDIFAQCDNNFRRAQCGNRDHPLKPAHEGPYINHPGEEPVSRRRSLLLAVHIWMSE